MTTVDKFKLVETADKFKLIKIEITDRIQESIKHLTPVGKLLYLKSLLLETQDISWNSFTEFMYREYTVDVCKILLEELNNAENTSL